MSAPSARKGFASRSAPPPVKGGTARYRAFIQAAISSATCSTSAGWPAR